MDGLTADTSSPSQGSSVHWYPRGHSQSRSRSRSQALPSRSESAGALHQGTDALRQNIYENFMRELETEGGRLGSGSGGGGGEERQSTDSTETSSEEALGSLEQLDLLFEKEQGVVRRAGWLSFKPLITLHKDRKLELVPRRKWKHYWVTLKGKAMGISPAVRPRPWCAVQCSFPLRLCPWADLSLQSQLRGAWLCVSYAYGYYTCLCG